MAAPGRRLRAVHGRPRRADGGRPRPPRRRPRRPRLPLRAGRHSWRDGHHQLWRLASLAGAAAIIGGVAEAELRRRRAGRPRLRPASDAEVAPRAEILDAAAELFVGQGLAATTTRQIAERVGIRQASLYYYFTGKDEILLELLTQSVRPSL